MVIRLALASLLLVLAGCSVFESDEGRYRYTATDADDVVVARGTLHLEFGVNDVLDPGTVDQVLIEAFGDWDLDRGDVFGFESGGARGAAYESGVTRIELEHAGIEAARYVLTGTLSDDFSRFAGTWTRNPFTGPEGITSGGFTLELAGDPPRVYPGG